MSADCFHVYPLEHGPKYDDRQGPLPALVSCWQDAASDLEDGATHFGYVYSGECRLESEAGTFAVAAGMFFAVPGPARLTGNGQGLLIARFGHRGWFQLGGPIERTGRLRYIDGCTDSLLIAPLSLGDPCLNLLHIPPGTNQTAHTHPSLRAGVVVRGRGLCRTETGETELAPGSAFVIEPDGLNSFHTGRDELLIVAWHPDSDFGPTDEDHPMLNRTIVALK